MAAKKLFFVFALIYVADCATRNEKVLSKGTIADEITKPRAAFEDTSGVRIVRSTRDVIPPKVSASELHDKNAEDAVPKIESRSGIKAGVCPVGHISVGGFCFPDYN